MSSKSQVNKRINTKKTRSKIPSCNRCRLRKVKCDYNTPCGPCSRSHSDCTRITTDKRKERFSVDYINGLKNKVNDLERILEKSKDLIGAAHNLLNLGKEENEGNIRLATISNAVSDLTLSPMDSNDELNFRDYDSHNLTVYGPSSVFNSESINNQQSEEYEIKCMSENLEVLRLVKLFFKWQYPDHNIFVYREAFLIDFFNPKVNCSYCSVELVLAICALASRMESNDKLNSKSKSYFDEAKKKLLNKLDTPSITSMQAFLLLAFYELCQGNNSSCWMLSGNGLRMGFDFGFQLHPKVWFLELNKSLSHLNVSIRSRIYWGCFMADHFISLLLGRPSLLRISDASIPDTSDLPDMKWIDQYTYLKPGRPEREHKNLAISSPLKSLIKLITISDNMLSDIFTKGDKDCHDVSKLKLLSRVGKLLQYNSDILQWKLDLPESLQWDKRILKETADDPTVMSIRYYYYLLLLCQNRPFIQVSKCEMSTNQNLIPHNLCHFVIDELTISIDRFTKVHGFRKVSIFIVYCSILSVSVIFLSNSDQTLCQQDKEKILFFLNVLKGASKTWKLAEKSYNLIILKLEKHYSNQLLVMLDYHLDEDCTTIISERPNSLELKKCEYESDNHNKGTDQPSMEPVENESRELNLAAMSLGQNSEHLGGPPLLMTSELFGMDWESLFPDYISNKVHTMYSD